ncbi:hypothetical protein [Streptomyces sp. NRRL S-813]|uniref:hypothetical protein n=1 Tax=Streptomyces sp. NRRL S-813 TaxID=1463919 RepID=UPI0004BF4BA3|nr:hypothetical protein [Streptomyces sp. NRRL S-813]
MTEQLLGGRVRGHRPTFVPPTTEDEFSTETIDWYAVERAISGEDPRPPLNQDELREAALWLRRHDIPRAAVSTRLCVYERLVREWEAEAGMLDPDQLCTRDGCGKARAGRGLCTVHLTADRKWRQAIASLEVAA